jgi:hypothetical protein
MVIYKGQDPDPTKKVRIRNTVFKTLIRLFLCTVSLHCSMKNRCWFTVKFDILSPFFVEPSADAVLCDVFR